MNKFILFFLSFGLSLALVAQNVQSGIVSDAFNNLPLKDVQILKNGVQITKTNAKGFFSVECIPNQELVFKLNGYKDNSQNFKKCGEKQNISLQSLSQNFGEIQVIDSNNIDKKMLLEPQAISRINEAELQRGTGLYLTDAINTNVPGVYMQKRANSSGQTFNIRGYGNGTRGTRGVSSNFDGQGSKVYLNGILITDAEGVTILDDIDFGSINQVEVSKGPSGTLYGLAIAGAVNMQTRKAASNTSSINQETMIGSYGLFRSTTRLELGTEKMSLMVNYGKQQYEGFSPHTSAHKNFVNMMMDYKVNAKQSISTYIGYSDSYDQRNGELTTEQYNTFDYSGNSRYIKNDAHSAMKSFRAGASHQYKFNKKLSNTTSIFGSSLLSDNSSAGGWGDKSSVNYGFRSTFDLNFKLSDKVKLTSISGLEFQKMHAISGFYSMGADSTNLAGYNVITGLRSMQELSNSTGSAFSQWTLVLPMDFSITAGVGYSIMNLSTSDRLWGTTVHPSTFTPQGYKANYKDMISPNFAINKRINKVMSVYASYSVGYKAPTSSYFFVPQTGEVNTDLKPEKGTQHEIGTKGTLLKNKFIYTVALFNTFFQDKMTTVSVQDETNTTTLYSYMVNGGQLNNKGLEVLVKYEMVQKNGGIFKSVKPFMNLTYSDFKYEDYRYESIGKDVTNTDSNIVADYSGNIVAGVPKVVFNAGIDVETKFGLYGNVTYNYRGAMYYTSDNLNETKAYQLLNAKLGFRKQISKFTFDVYAAVNNITSTQYYYMVFVNQIPDAYIAAPNDINFFGGINLKYNF